MSIICFKNDFIWLNGINFKEINVFVYGKFFVVISGKCSFQVKKVYQCIFQLKKKVYLLIINGEYFLCYLGKIIFVISGGKSIGKINFW